MLTSLRIKNFRLFDNFELSDLSRINVLTGTNACGKTSLLEAAYLAAGAANATLTMILYNLRGESALTQNFDRPFRSLFLDLDPSNEIEIRAEGSFERRKKSTIRHLRITPIQGGIPVSRSTKEGAPISGLAFRFTGQHGTETGSIYLETVKSESNQPGQITQRLRTDPIKNRDVISGIFSTPYYRELWPQAHKFLTDLTKTGKASELVAQLSMLEPRIKNLIPLSDQGIDTIYVDVGRKSLMPVTLLGTGFANALHILLDLASLESGMLMVDEIEIGLHHSVTARLLEHLYSAAKKKNIQVFVTTHSEEMLYVFADVARKTKFSELALFKMRKADDKITYDRFSLKDVIAAREIHGELR